MVRPQVSDEAKFGNRDLGARRRVRLPEDLFADREVAPLLLGEVSFDQATVSAPEVVQRVRPILPDVDLSVRIRDLVDDGRQPKLSRRWRSSQDLTLGVAGPSLGRLGRRVVGVAARGRGAASQQPETLHGLG
jgi:hypothetical protein